MLFRDKIEIHFRNLCNRNHLKKMTSQNLVLVFDVETNGLFPKKPPASIAELPFVLQLSWLLYDRETRAIVETYNQYIKIDESISIPDEITTLTGITYAKCAQGVPIADAINSLYEAYMKSSLVVAHNIEFDSQMIHLEILRNRSALDRDIEKNMLYICRFASPVFRRPPAPLDVVSHIPIYCTMMKGSPLCAIPSKSKKPSSADPYKWPKLSELHHHLFGTIPEGLHDSMVDITACLDCYIKMTA